MSNNIVGLYVIKDCVMEECSAPFCAKNRNVAKLQFDKACAQAIQAGYKSEFKLFHVGSFDPDDGSITPIEPFEIGIGELFDAVMEDK